MWKFNKNNNEKNRRRKSEKMKKKKNITIEILRIIACFFVIVCHTYGWGFDKKIFDLTWFLSVAIYLISKTAVPIFFMISGALYLKKDYSYKEMFRKIIFRILVPLILFSALLYFKENRECSLTNLIKFFNKLLAGKILEHYWFLYTLIGLYLAIPFIRKMILNLLLIPKFKADGAAIASVIAEFIILIVQIIYLIVTILLLTLIFDTLIG